ncbi:aldehyde dehydrogenase family protein, partial [Burkholderia multivorans]|uniref:aldehyde dehydrogenase family protein n=1 Tax=Burkholderia multivorans TaxID=87883 RepID=UPI003D358726
MSGARTRSGAAPPRPPRHDSTTPTHRPASQPGTGATWPGTTGAGMEEAKHFIAGEWTLPAQLETIAVIDPSDGQPFATIARGTAPDIERAVAAARDAFAGAWGA